MEKATWMIITLAIGLTMVESSKVLVIPFGIYSHINLFGILGKALSDDGHEVWMLAANEYEADIKRRGIVPLTFPLKREDDFMRQIDKWTAESPTCDGDKVSEKYFNDPWWNKATGRVCDTVMQSERIMTTIRKQKFDLIVYDGTDVNVCFLMIPYKFDIRFVTVHMWQLTPWTSGVTGMPSIEPEFLNPFTNRMDFWQRLKNLDTWRDRINHIFFVMFNDHHVNSYCPQNKPKIPLEKIAEMSEMYFLNFEIMCLDYPRVSAPNMQYLGALAALPAKPLPKDLETFIAGAKHGVVLMTFGSMKAPQHVWKIIGEQLFNAFARLQQRVIIQYRLDTVYGTVPANVKLMKWLPQNDILGNKNVKLFIMHGGNNGQNEAIYHGVPMLVMPLLMDQMYNCKRIEAHNYGKCITDKITMTSHDFYEMMIEILENKTYTLNTKKCSEIIRSMPTAQEKFVFWVNHILRFGGAHLRPPSLDMPLYQVLMLDIVAYYVFYYLVIAHVVMFSLYFLIKCLLRYFKKAKIE